jgi:2,4-dienoyl-CoA reductase-like NADH-dependent reductase (Old Yellow Enzyme family)/NADPH-dependent 2,4-dienoyl-CoA reductase/sulfur reductase-like enzyme
MAHLQNLFQPIAIGPLEVRNRLVMTNHSGAPPHRSHAYYEARARGGVGLMILPTGGVGVAHYSSSPGGFRSTDVGDADVVYPNPATPEGISYFDGLVIPALRELVAVCKPHGAICFLQVYHLGAGRCNDNLQPTVAPSSQRDEEDRSIPHELNHREIRELVIAFANAVRRARDAGMDGVELNGAHGYLINQFLSPYTNHRVDDYGGSLENRLRFLVEIIDESGRLAGTNYPIGLRINGDELVEGGLVVDDAADIVRRLEDRLVYVNVSSGNSTGLKHGLKVAYASSRYTPSGHNVALAARIKQAVRIPVIVAGRMLDPVEADRHIAAGHCDLVGMARALIADPDLPNKALSQQMNEIRPCIGYNECHLTDTSHKFHRTRIHMVCAVNPAATREEEMAVVPTEAPRRVMVIGGGPAGMEAAATAALRGHDVVLYDRLSELGGQLLTVARDPSQSHLWRFIEYQKGQVHRSGVDVRLDTLVDRSLVQTVAPDAVVVATGSEPFIPTLPGVDSSHVTNAVAVLRGEARLGHSVLVIAGLEDHVVPLAIADLLATRGHEVRLAAETVTIGAGVERRTQLVLLKRLLEKGVVLLPMTSVTGIYDRSVSTFHTLTAAAGQIEDVDSIVIAMGGRAVDGLADALAERASVHLIGDSLAPRRLVHAVLDGARIGRAI